VQWGKPWVCFGGGGEGRPPVGSVAGHSTRVRWERGGPGTTLRMGGYPRRGGGPPPLLRRIFNLSLGPWRGEVRAHGEGPGPRRPGQRPFRRGVRPISIGRRQSTRSSGSRGEPPFGLRFSLVRKNTKYNQADYILPKRITVETQKKITFRNLAQKKRHPCATPFACSMIQSI